MHQNMKEGKMGFKVERTHDVATYAVAANASSGIILTFA